MNNNKDLEINYKRYLIHSKKEEIKCWKNTIKDYKIDIAELVLAGAKLEDINKYVRFIEKHLEDINELDLEIAKLVIEINELEKNN